MKEMVEIKKNGKYVFRRINAKLLSDRSADGFDLSELTHQARVMDAARRGLIQACLRFDPLEGVKFISSAEFWIRHSVRRCLAKEVPKSDLIVDYLPPNLKKCLQAYKPSAERLALQKKRRRDVAISIQWEKAVKQGRLYRKLIKSKKKMKGVHYAGRNGDSAPCGGDCRGGVAENGANQSGRSGEAGKRTASQD